jgi:4,5-dihydroxyphthalate decarboxylase
MHTIAIRKTTFEANRWIARNLMTAFEEAKNRSVARILDLTAAHVPLPWVYNLAQHVLKLNSGHGLWPYGVEPNRTTLEAFLRWACVQGVCHRELRPEDIFAPEALAEIRV